MKKKRVLVVALVMAVIMSFSGCAELESSINSL